MPDPYLEGITNKVNIVRPNPPREVMSNAEYRRLVPGLEAEIKVLQDEVKRLKDMAVEAFHPEFGSVWMTIDHCITELEERGRPSQAADPGWHEALQAVRESISKEFLDAYSEGRRLQHGITNKEQTAWPAT